MAHVLKHTKTAVGHMVAYYDRSANNIGNVSIDFKLTKYNYNLAPKRDVSQGEFIKNRCSEVKCLKRKDVNVMCSWVVTAPKILNKKEYEKFFKTSYEFLKNRYGGEKNVVSSYVQNLQRTRKWMRINLICILPLFQ